MRSLIPRPHPRGGKRVWWTFGWILGSRSMAHADKAMQSLVLIGCYGYICMWSQPVIKLTLNLIGQWNWIAYTAIQQWSMLHSCGKLVMWLSQSFDLIGAWKFLSAGLRILPKFIRPFSSLEVGSGDETVACANVVFTWKAHDSDCTITMRFKGEVWVVPGAAAGVFKSRQERELSSCLVAAEKVHP